MTTGLIDPYPPVQSIGIYASDVGNTVGNYFSKTKKKELRFNATP